jgi:hypothetical protein
LNLFVKSSLIFKKYGIWIIDHQLTEMPFAGHEMLLKHILCEIVINHNSAYEKFSKLGKNYDTFLFSPQYSFLNKLFQYIEKGEKNERALSMLILEKKISESAQKICKYLIPLFFSPNT